MFRALQHGGQTPPKGGRLSDIDDSLDSEDMLPQVMEWPGAWSANVSRFRRLH